MKNLAVIDQTQRELGRHLAVTEKLLAQAVSKVSGCDMSAEVWLMPDLGLPHSVRRMLGGFFTGMLAKWDCSEPFVPIDSTVKVCAVGIYHVDNIFHTAGAFVERIEKVRQAMWTECSYGWNFNSGNHFITLAVVGSGQGLPEGHYLVLHSSACEFKLQRNGLYPSAGNWYADRITQIGDAATGRHLRYLHGKVADLFFRQANLLLDYNRIRLHYFAEAIMAGIRVEEVSYHPHYGMPDQQSVAIGCQWLPKDSTCLLLTAPGEKLLLMQPYSGKANQIQLAGRDCVLVPHGLGVKARNNLDLTYLSNGLQINGRKFDANASLKSDGEFTIRGTDGDLDQIVNQLLASCPGQITSELKPLFSYPTNNNTELCH
jgi:hypothetical protein